MIYDAPHDEVVAIDGREEAPAAYTYNVFLDEDGNPISFNERRPVATRWAYLVLWPQRLGP